MLSVHRGREKEMDAFIDRGDGERGRRTPKEKENGDAAECNVPRLRLICARDRYSKRL